MSAPPFSSVSSSPSPEYRADIGGRYTFRRLCRDVNIIIRSIRHCFVALPLVIVKNRLGMIHIPHPPCRRSRAVAVVQGSRRGRGGGGSAADGGRRGGPLRCCLRYTHRRSARAFFGGVFISAVGGVERGPIGLLSGQQRRKRS